MLKEPQKIEVPFYAGADQRAACRFPIMAGDADELYGGLVMQENLS